MNRTSETKFLPDDPLITAYALGELDGEEHARVATAVAADPALAAAVAEIRATGAQLSAALASEPLPVIVPPVNGKGVALAHADNSDEADEASLVHRREPWRTHPKKVRPFPYFYITGLAAACFVVAFVAFQRDHGRKEAQRLADLKAQQEFDERMRHVIVVDLRTGQIDAAVPGAQVTSRNSSAGDAFLAASKSPVSSFSLVVGNASYARLRAALEDGKRPARDDVRIEELVNHFAYDYAAPAAADVSPISTSLEVAAAPWAADHRLVRIGLRARDAEDNAAVVARDVSVQVAFNPEQVQSYRLIGYENNTPAAGDPDGAAIHGIDITSGRTVTALYDIVPTRAASPEAQLLTLSLHYKLPGSDALARADYPLVDPGTTFDDASTDFKFAASVAGFGMLLRDSPNRGDVSYDKLLTWAGRGADPSSPASNHRTELITLVQRARDIAL